ncbi:MAG: crossover junction endodeoxyribonuclease RuvC [Verrucomicrobiota bacterium]|jgi:crossover junction endodeoxyribonuclease RuvC
MSESPFEPAKARERLISIDPSLRGTGYAVLEHGGDLLKPVALTYGVIRNGPKLLHSGCLVEIHRVLTGVLAEFRPTVAAFEAVIFVQSLRTAMTLGSARGVAILAAAALGLEIYEYAPRRVKQAVVGHGGADKSQVGFMVRAMLGLTETPPADAADALAIGLTHLQMSVARGLDLTTKERI